MQDSNLPLFDGPEITTMDDAKDKIAGRLDVCEWKPLKSKDAMDQIISCETEQDINVETNTVSTTKPKVVVNVETKRCFVKLAELDSILFGTEPNDSGPVVENEQPSSVEQEPLPRLRPKYKKQ